MTGTDPVVICALPGCNNPVPPQAAGARRKRDYCSNACRQKAYRNRHHSLVKRNTQFVTFWEQAADAIEHLTQAQLHSLKQRIDAKLGISATAADSVRKLLVPPTPTRASRSRQPAQSQSTQAELLCLRKGKGVVHLAVNRHLTLCGKDADPMQDAAYQEDQLCQRCRTIRDTQTWWQSWREAFDDTVYQATSA